MIPKGEIFSVVGTGGINFHGLSGKPSWVKFQQDDDFGILDIKITNNGYKLEGRYHTNSGQQLDKFTITKTGPASYTFGPSLTLSGENAESNVQPNDGNTANSNDNNGSSRGKLKDKERDLIVNTLPSKDQCAAEKNKRVRFLRTKFLLQIKLHFLSYYAQYQSNLKTSKHSMEIFPK